MYGTRFKELKNYLKKNNYPTYTYDQIRLAIFKHHTIDFGSITNISKELRASLKAEFGNILSIDLEKYLYSPSAQKYLFKTEDKHPVETVLLCYKDRKEEMRTLCVSCQSGCPVGCKFCVTGDLGLLRSLTDSEILDQILFVLHKGENIRNIVFMGMGEPFLNWGNVAQALNSLLDQKMFNIGARHISVSTVGIVDKIYNFTKMFPQVNLAFSLHTPFQDQREELIPIARKYNLVEVFRALDNHLEQTNRKIFIEYVMLKNINDTVAHAKAVANLISPKNRKKWYLYHVNLIRYNTGSRQKYESSDEQTVKQFVKILKKSKIQVTVRPSLGGEIMGACGQLGKIK